MNIDAVLKTEFVEALAKRVVGAHRITLSRPACFIVKAEEENERDINRLIVLPPKGFTSNKINQTNSFEGVEKATIQVKGAVKAGKHGFSNTKDCLLVVSFNSNAGVSKLERPYVEFDLKDPRQKLTTQTRSSHEPPFHVVKTDGTGFYHTLINLSDDWLTLQLHKTMRPQKKPELEFHLATLQDEHSNVLRHLYDGIIDFGDELFDKQPELISKVLTIPHSVTFPALAEMLYVRDTGKHEACTAFAIILKMAKTAPEEILSNLQESLKSDSAPKYLTTQLIQKIKNAQNKDLGQPEVA